MRGLPQRTPRRLAAQSGAPSDEGSLPADRPAAGDPAAAAAADPPAAAAPDSPAASDPPASPRPPRAQRARLRRRLAELRELRDEQLLDLGGFVFDLYRFGRQHDDLVRSKLDALIASDREIMEIERQLDEARAAREVPHRSVGTCPHCATLHTSDSRFCRECGAALGESDASGRRATPAPADSTVEVPFPQAAGPPATDPGARPQPPPAPADPAGPDQPPPGRANQPAAEPVPVAPPDHASTASDWLPPALTDDPARAAEPSPPPATPPPEPQEPAQTSVWHPPPPASAPGDSPPADREDAQRR